MDFLMESGFMQWMSERISFTNWVKADFHGSSGINVGQTEEAEDLYLYADASHTQIFRPNRRGYNARANDLNLPILWLDF